MTDSDSAHGRISTFGRDMTVRWSTRDGDIVLWMGYQSPASPATAVTVNDVWQMRDGEFVTFTNRLCDIPSWFGLRYDEMTQEQARLLSKDYAQPADPLGGPNIWRIGAGSRVAWVRPSLGTSNPEDAILGVLDFRANALGLGETDMADIDYYMSFGVHGVSTADSASSGHVAYLLVQSLGCPRELSTEWLFGG